MLSLVKQVTFLRPAVRAYSNAYRQIFSQPGRLMSLRHCVDLAGLAVLDAAVGVLLVLADDDDVHHRVLRLDERIVRDARPHIGEQPERLADGHVQTLVAARPAAS